MYHQIRRAGRVLRPAIGVALLLLAGCATAPPRALSPDEVLAQLPVLQERADTRPDDADAQANLGLALFVLRDTRASATLERAFQMDRGRPEVALALGTLRESRGDLAGAAEVYSASAAASGRGEDEIRARLDRVEHDLLLGQMKTLAGNERSVEVANIPQNTLAVMDFASGTDDPALGSLGKALAVVLTTEISRLPGVRLIERQRLSVLQAELDLASGGTDVGPRPVLASSNEILGVQQRLALLTPGPGAAPFYAGPADGRDSPAVTEAVRAFQAHAGIQVDGLVGPETRRAFLAAMEARFLQPASPVSADTAPRAGRLLGARRMLGGRYTKPGEDRLAVQSQFLDVVTDSVMATVAVEKNLDEFYALPGEITVRVAEALGIALEPAERRRLMELPPATRSLPAFLAFGRGARLEELGLWDEAEVRYREAMQLDPEFLLARDRASVVSLASASPAQAANDLASTAGSAVGEAVEPASTGNPALSEAVAVVGTGIGEGQIREGGGIDRPDQSVGPVTGTARITIFLPRGNR